MAAQGGGGTNPSQLAAARSALLASLLVAASGLALPVAAKEPPQADLDAALGWLRAEGQDGYGPLLAPYIVEAAHASGDDALAAAALPEVRVAPATPGSTLSLLRPYHALALRRELGTDRLDDIRGAWDGNQTGSPDLLMDDAWAILALHAAGVPAADSQVQGSATHLLAHARGGGWSWSASGREAETDVTGMVLAALRAAGRLGDADGAAAIQSVEAARMGDGYALRPGGVANCDSTVWAIRSWTLLDPDGAQGAGLASAWSFLDGLQGADGGFAWQPGQASNGICTAEAATLLGDLAAGQLRRPPAAAGRPDGAVAAAPATLLAAAVLGAALVLRARRA